MNIAVVKNAFRAFKEKNQELMEKAKITILGLEDEPAKLELVATGKLQDGTTVASPDAEFKEGSELYVIDAEGKETPAPDGEHTLEDGTIVTTVAGKITAITEIETETEMSAEEIAANLEELGTKLSSALTENEALKAELEALKAEKVTQSAEIEKMKTDIAKLKKQPAAQSVKQTSEKVAETKKEDKPVSPKDAIRARVIELASQKSN